MPNRTVYLPQHIDDKFRDDPDRKGLVARLLSAHYATTKPGIAMPTIDKEYKERVREKRKGMYIKEIPGMRIPEIDGMKEDKSVIPMTPGDWGA